LIVEVVGVAIPAEIARPELILPLTLSVELGLLVATLIVGVSSTVLISLLIGSLLIGSLGALCAGAVDPQRLARLLTAIESLIRRLLVWGLLGAGAETALPLVVGACASCCWSACARGDSTCAIGAARRGRVSVCGCCARGGASSAGRCSARSCAGRAASARPASAGLTEDSYRTKQQCSREG